MPGLYRLSATQAVALLRSGEIHAFEGVEATLARFDAVDGAVSAQPMAIPIIGKPRAEAAVLSAAQRVEEILGLANHAAIGARVRHL